MSYSRQQIFDRVAKHLIKQGRKATSDDGFYCLYRTQDGLKCAAGCLIKDNDYRPSMERKGVLARGWLEDFPHLPKYFKIHSKFISELQTVHDQEHNWPDITSALRRFAREHKLKWRLD